MKTTTVDIGKLEENKMSESSNFILVTYAQGEIFERSQEKLEETFLAFCRENEGSFPPSHAKSIKYSEESIRHCSWYKDISALKNGKDQRSKIYYWAWKSCILLDVLNEQSKEGDVILYCDSSRYDRRGFVKNPLALFDLMSRERYNILTSGFSYYLLNSHQSLYADSSIFNDCGGWFSFHSPHVVASHLVIRNCDSSKKLLNEWVQMCCDHALIKRNRVGDQALLNALIQKHKVPAIDVTKRLTKKLLPHRELKSINYIISSLNRLDDDVSISVPEFSMTGFLLGWIWEGLRIQRRMSLRLKKFLHLET